MVGGPGVRCLNVLRTLKAFSHNCGSVTVILSCDILYFIFRIQKLNRLHRSIYNSKCVLRSTRLVWIEQVTDAFIVRLPTITCNEYLPVDTSFWGKERRVAASLNLSMECLHNWLPYRRGDRSNKVPMANNANHFRSLNTLGHDIGSFILTHRLFPLLQYVHWMDDNNRQGKTVSMEVVRKRIVATWEEEELDVTKSVFLNVQRFKKVFVFVFSIIVTFGYFPTFPPQLALILFSSFKT